MIHHAAIRFIMKHLDAAFHDEETRVHLTQETNDSHLLVCLFVFFRTSFFKENHSNEVIDRL
jgi:hypothetical protein